MNRFTLYALQLRDPLPDVLSLTIEPLALQQRVEDSEVGLRIHARRGTKSPSSIVRREIAIDQVLHEISLAHPPVEEEVLREERSCDHAAAVVHPPTMVELPHRSIDDGITSLALAPGLEMMFVVFPGYISVLVFERLVHAGKDQSTWNLCEGDSRDLPDIGPVS